MSWLREVIKGWFEATKPIEYNDDVAISIHVEYKGHSYLRFAHITQTRLNPTLPAKVMIEQAAITMGVICKDIEARGG